MMEKLKLGILSGITAVSIGLILMGLNTVWAHQTQLTLLETTSPANLMVTRTNDENLRVTVDAIYDLAGTPLGTNLNLWTNNIKNIRNLTGIGSGIITGFAKIYAGTMELSSISFATGSISSADIANWNTNYQWYLVSSGGMAYVFATTGNWDTAYSWGDHAGEGYLKAGSNVSSLANDSEFASSNYSDNMATKTNWGNVLMDGDPACAGAVFRDVGQIQGSGDFYIYEGPGAAGSYFHFLNGWLNLGVDYVVYEQPTVVENGIYTNFVSYGNAPTHNGTNYVLQGVKVGDATNADYAATANNASNVPIAGVSGKLGSFTFQLFTNAAPGNFALFGPIPYAITITNLILTGDGGYVADYRTSQATNPYAFTLFYTGATYTAGCAGSVTNLSLSAAIGAGAFISCICTSGATMTNAFPGAQYTW